MHNNMISEDDLIALAQYDSGINDYFNLTKEKADQIREAVNTNEELKSKYLEYKESVPSLKSNSARNWKMLSSAAAVIIIAFSTYLMVTSPAAPASFTINDFNLKILRSATDQNYNRDHRYIYELREGKHVSVMLEIELDPTYNNLKVKAAAYALTGLQNEEAELIHVAIESLMKLDDQNREQFAELIEKLKQKAEEFK